MYDTVTLRLQHPDAGNVPKLLPGLRESADTRTGELAYRGWLENMWIKGNSHSISIANSLCVFKHGNNLADVSLSDTGSAIEELSDILHLPMGDSTVTTLHLARNLPMSIPPSCYFPLLAYSSRYKRRDWGGETLYFTKSAIELAFYDKSREVMSHRGAIAPRVGENLLRYEVRLNKGIHKRLGLPVVTASNLSERWFLNRYVDVWEGEYEAIEKSPLPVSPPRDLSQRNVMLWLASEGLKVIGGEGPALAIVNSSMKGASKSARYRARQNVRKIAQTRGDDSLITELDGKIHSAAEELRGC